MPTATAEKPTTGSNSDRLELAKLVAQELQDVSRGGVRMRSFNVENGAATGEFTSTNDGRTYTFSWKDGRVGYRPAVAKQDSETLDRFHVRWDSYSRRTEAAAPESTRVDSVHLDAGLKCGSGNYFCGGEGTRGACIGVQKTCFANSSSSGSKERQNKIKALIATMEGGGQNPQKGLGKATVKQLKEAQQSVAERRSEFAGGLKQQRKAIERAQQVAGKEVVEPILKKFGVKTAAALEGNTNYLMATKGQFDLSSSEGWKQAHRKTVGVLPGEDNEKDGPGVVNGIDIFKYDRPWQAFGLDPKKATDKDIKDAYRTLSKKYHPDNPQTGDRKTFERLNQFYQSLTQKF